MKGRKESTFSRSSTLNDIIVQPLRAYAGCLQRLLCAGILLAATAVASATELFDFSRSFDPAQLTARGVTIAVADGALDIKGTVPASDSGVVFPLPVQAQDLSRFRIVEADVENTGDKPLRFTFWALSGHGWGGVSTFTPDGGPAAGRETLAPGQRGKFKIDLHTRYPGKDVYTPATNPASIRWLELVVGDSRITPSLRVWSLRATGEAPAERPDVSRRVLVPDITRDPPDKPQLTFGSGIHYCLGAALARAEQQEALVILSQRLANLELAGVVVWKPTLVGIFGPEHLPVRFTPS